MNGWTKADVTRLRDVMRSQGRGIDEMADEVRAVCKVTRLASYRLAHGLSQPQAVARCRELAEGSGFDQPTLSRLEQFPAPGSRTPLAVQLMALATAYGTQPVRLLTPDALDLLDPREREVILRLAPMTGRTEPPAPGEHRPSSGMGLRPETRPRIRPGAVPQQTGASEPGYVGLAARRAFQFTALVEGSNVGPETLAEIEAEVRRLAVSYPQRPSGCLLPELTQLQDVGFRLLEGRQRPPQATRLYLMTGIVSGMLAKVSHDLGDAVAAMTQARTAYVCADNADHNGLRAWIRGQQSLICYWAGWPQDALRYARLGAEAVGPGGGTGSVAIAAHEARAWGMVGNEAATVQALARAGRVRDQVSDDELDEIGGILTFPHSRQLYYAADALSLIPEQKAAAERLAVEAITAFEQSAQPQRSFSDEAGARCDLSLVRAQLGDAEGAEEAIRSVLLLPVSHRITGVVASAQRVHGASADLGAARAGRELRTRLQAFCLRPAREGL